jgi:hypothetical protein
MKREEIERREEDRVSLIEEKRRLEATKEKQIRGLKERHQREKRGSKTAKAE